jgi:hypothetical protein
LREPVPLGAGRLAEDGRKSLAELTPAGLIGHLALP